MSGLVSHHVLSAFRAPDDENSAPGSPVTADDYSNWGVQSSEHSSYYVNAYVL